MKTDCESFLKEVGIDGYSCCWGCHENFDHGSQEPKVVKSRDPEGVLHLHYICCGAWYALLNQSSEVKSKVVFLGEKNG